MNKTTNFSPVRPWWMDIKFKIDARRRGVRRVVTSLVAVLAYLALFLLFEKKVGFEIVALTLVPAAVIAWNGGLRWGIAGSALLLLLDGLLMAFQDPGMLRRKLWPVGLINAMTVLGVGVIVGWTRQWFVQARVDYRERRKAEAALLTSKEKFRCMFDNMAEGMAISRLLLDENGQVEDWVLLNINSAYETIFGVARGAVTGRRASQIFGSQMDLGPYLELYETALESGIPAEMTVNFMNRNQWLKMNATPLGDDEIAVLISDITEEHNAVEAEREQRRMAEALRDIAAALTSTLQLEDVLDRIIIHIQTVASFDAMNIMLIDQGRVRAVRHHGYAERGLTGYIEGFNRRLEDMPAMGWMIENHRPLIIPDTQMVNSWQVFPPTSWIRSYAGIPISRRGEVIGFLNLNSAAPEFFQPEYIDRLQPFADQAALAIENAMAYEGIQNGARRLAVLNRASGLLNTPVELPTILRVTLDCLADTLALDSAALHLYDDHHRLGVVAASRNGAGLPVDEAPLLARGVAAYLKESNAPLLVQNGDPDPLPGEIRPRMQAAGVCALLLLPLISGDGMIGVVECGLSGAKKYFSMDEVDLAGSIASLAAVRIEQARTYEAERRQVSALGLLHASSLDINMNHNQPDLLKTIVQRAARLMHANGGTLYLRGPENDTLTCIISHDFPSNEEGVVVKFGESAAGLSAQSGQPLVVDDYGAWEHRIAAFESSGLSFALLTAPVIWDGRVTGVLQLYRTDLRANFTAQDIELLTLFCGQVAVALENTRLYEEIQQLAIRDSLTGLYNRRGLFEVGTREIERAARYQRPLSVCMLDIDHFKTVNDTYGHMVGDEVLARLGKRLADSLRSMDVVGRYGGEEFVILAVENEAESAHRMAERLCRIISDHPFVTSAGLVRVTVSIGVVTLSESTSDMPGLLQAADQALYLAKASGRNQVKCFDPVLPVAA